MTVPTGNPRDNEAELRSLLARQHGLVTTTQAQGLGLSSSALSKRARRGVVEKILPGVWRSTSQVPGTLQRILGAVLWAGDGAVASHFSAGQLWGLQDLPDELHIWTQTRKRSPLVVTHRGVIEARDLRMRDGIRVTSSARTLVDLASMLDDELLEAAVESFLHRGLTTPFAIARCLDAVGGKGRGGSGRLRRLLEDRGDRALESRLEVKLWRLMRSAGLRPVRQFEVHCDGRRYRLDFAWPKLKVAVEADGFGAHGGRRSFVADRRRAADLVADGWLVISVTWADCEQRPETVIRWIGAALLRAA